MQPGDCIILDFGCLWEGLHSDMTRTIFLEPVPAEFKRLYWLLYRAQTAAEAAAQEGAYVSDIDAAARAVLAEENLASACTTRVGHGIGYMTHEDGRREILNRASKDLISIGRGGVTVTPPRVC